MTKQTNNFVYTILSDIKRKRLFAILVLFITMVGFINAVRFGGASLDYYGVRNAIEAWQKGAQVQTKEEFENAERAIYSANSLHQSHPLYVELAGQVKEWGVVSGFDQNASLMDAKRHYLMATTIRPLWPVTWANLAMVKWRLQEFDDEMMNYLSRANELGPYSVEVHILFTQLGITLYQANHPMYIKIKDIVHERIRLGLRNGQSKQAIVAFIENTSSLPIVCRWMERTDRYTARRQLPCA